MSEATILERFRIMKRWIETGQIPLGGTREEIAEVRALTDADIQTLFRELGAEHTNDAGEVDVAALYFKVHHHFPLPEWIKPQLRLSLKHVNNTDNPTILRACRIWYDIVRIHISHEANKRSGKAIGSAILLRGGYLPPKIGKEHSEEYVRVMMEGFQKEGDAGFEDFVAFVVERMRETQAERSGVNAGAGEAV